MPAISELVGAVAAAVRAGAGELTELDRAIGDGDLGLNLRRGFDTVAELGPELDAMPIGGALHEAGMTLVMKVGGSSGPLYGSLLMAFGRSLPEEPGPRDVVGALQAGVDAVRRRGKSDVGDKTMLDVLVPVCDALEEGVARSVDAVRLLDEVTEAARRGLESTRDLEARKGRASYLGERSIGHLDPGARAIQLIVETVCASLRGRC